MSRSVPAHKVVYQKRAQSKLRSSVSSSQSACSNEHNAGAPARASMIAASLRSMPHTEMPVEASACAMAPDPQPKSTTDDPWRKAASFVMSSAALWARPTVSSWRQASRSSSSNTCAIRWRSAPVPAPSAGSEGSVISPGCRRGSGGKHDCIVSAVCNTRCPPQPYWARTAGDKDSIGGAVPSTIFSGEANVGPIDSGIRGRICALIKELVEQEVASGLERARYEHGGTSGHRHRSLQLPGSFGPIEIAVPRALLRGGGWDGPRAVLPRPRVDPGRWRRRSLQPNSRAPSRAGCCGRWLRGSFRCAVS